LALPKGGALDSELSRSDDEDSEGKGEVSEANGSLSEEGYTPRQREEGRELRAQGELADLNRCMAFIQ